MSQIIARSRILVLGVAFVGVMAGAGGLLGAIGGLLLVLLSRAVLGIAAGIADLMPLSVMSGVLLALFLGIFLVVRQLPAQSLQTRVAPATRSGPQTTESTANIG